MKKVIFIALVTIIVSGLLLAGCGEKTTAPTTSATTTATTTTSHPTATTTAPTATTTAPVTTTTAPATTGVADTGQTWNLKFSYHTPPQASLVSTYLTPWTAAIEKATNGRVKITHYPSETLVKAKDQYDGLVSGLSDIALVDPAETPGRFTESEFDTLPFIFPDGGTAAKTYWDILQKYCVNTDYKETQLVAVAVIGQSNYAGNKPAQDVTDFRGMRVRSSGTTESWTVAALGAVPVEISTADITTSMERGLIDGTFLSWSYILSSGVKDVSKYRTECNMYNRVFGLFFNKKVWNSFPPSIQSAIMGVSGQAASATYSIANVNAGAGAKNAIAGSDRGAGKPAIYTLTDAQLSAWKAAVAPVWDKWVASLDAKKLPGQAIMDDIKLLNQKYYSAK